MRPTLYEFAGGDDAFLALATAHHARCLADPECRAALRAYMEWAVADVLVYSPTDAVVPSGLPMPRWSWEGLV